MSDIRAVLSDYASIVIAAGVLVSAIVAINAVVVRRLKTFIADATKQIQPTTNGGQTSLMDLHAKVDMHAEQLRLHLAWSEVQALRTSQSLNAMREDVEEIKDRSRLRREEDE